MLAAKDYDGKPLYSKNKICEKLGISKPKFDRYLKGGTVPNAGNKIFSAEEEVSTVIFFTRGETV